MSDETREEEKEDAQELQDEKIPEEEYHGPLVFLDSSWVSLLHKIESVIQSILKMQVSNFPCETGVIITNDGNNPENKRRRNWNNSKKRCTRSPILE